MKRKRGVCVAETKMQKGKNQSNVSKILSEVLPYLGISPDKIDVGTSSSNTLKTVPNIKNKTVSEAQKILTNAGFRSSFTVNGNKNEVLVTDQVPAERNKITK